MYLQNAQCKVPTQRVYFLDILIAGRPVSLEYFTLTLPVFLPREDDGTSDAIDVPGGFPFGSRTFIHTYVR